MLFDHIEISDHQQISTRLTSRSPAGSQINSAKACGILCCGLHRALGSSRSHSCRSLPVNAVAIRCSGDLIKLRRDNTNMPDFRRFEDPCSAVLALTIQQGLTTIVSYVVVDDVSSARANSVERLSDWLLPPTRESRCNRALRRLHEQSTVHDLGVSHRIGNASLVRGDWAIRVADSTSSLASRFASLQFGYGSDPLRVCAAVPTSHGQRAPAQSSPPSETQLDPTPPNATTFLSSHKAATSIVLESVETTPPVGHAHSKP